MRERNKVLIEFGTAECVLRDECTHFDCVAERNMADEIVRLREVLANYPETPDRSTRVTDKMVERAAKATVARVVAEAFELYADEEEAMRVHREYARTALAAALEGPRDE